MQLSLPNGVSAPEALLVQHACLSIGPLMFFESGYEEFPGLQGTCFAVEANRTTIFFTARHNLKSVRATTSIYTSTVLRSDRRTAIGGIIAPRTKNEHLGPLSDFAVLFPKIHPVSVAGEFQPIHIDSLTNLDGSPEATPFVVAGYPTNHPHGNQIDYEAKEIAFGPFVGIGKYAGRSEHQQGCHVLSIDTTNVGGPAGLSGSPVFQFLPQKGNYFLSWAGIVITGGPWADPVHSCKVSF